MIYCLEIKQMRDLPTWGDLEEFLSNRMDHSHVYAFVIHSK